MGMLDWTSKLNLMGQYLIMTVWKKGSAVDFRDSEANKNFNQNPSPYDIPKKKKNDQIRIVMKNPVEIVDRVVIFCLINAIGYEFSLCNNSLPY